MQITPGGWLGPGTWLTVGVQWTCGKCGLKVPPMVPHSCPAQTTEAYGRPA